MIDLEVRPCPGAVRGWGVVAHVSDGPWPPRHLPGHAGARHHRGVDGPPLRAEVALHSPVRRGLRPPPLASWASYIPRPLTPLSRLLYPLSPVLPLHTTPPVPLILLSHATYPISHLCPLTNIPRLIPHIPHPTSLFPFSPGPLPPLASLPIHLALLGWGRRLVRLHAHPDSVRRDGPAHEGKF